MKTLFKCAIGAAMLMAMPLTATAQPGQPERKPEQSTKAPAKKPAETKGPQGKPAPAQQGKPAQQSPYGQWDNSWGAKPPAPPQHFAKKGDWHRHVRACQRKFRSYNARTDTYRTLSGKAVRCRL